MCHDLLNVEPASKWGRLHLVFLYEKKVNLFICKMKKFTKKDL